MPKDIEDAWRRDKSNWSLKLVICCSLLLAAGYMYLRPLGSGCQDKILTILGAIYVPRFFTTLLVLMPRPPDWHEIPIVYMIFLPSVFYTLAYKRTDVCLPYTLPALVLYALGSLISSISEYQRWVFKATPAGKGRLMTTGLWAMCMHPNYLGDSLLFTGWTMISGGPWWSWWVPLVITGLFVGKHIPGLDEYLAERYPKEFPAYAKSTKKFVPWVY